LEFLARAIRQEEEIKAIPSGKEVIKLSLFADDMILYVKTQKTPRHHKQLQKSRIQNHLQKSVLFLYTNNEQTETEYRKIIPFTITSKKKKSNT
jgi:D-lyxose ketol-isomerase